jgi:hypothetical protein
MTNIRSTNQMRFFKGFAVTSNRLQLEEWNNALTNFVANAIEFWKKIWRLLLEYGQRNAEKLSF